jgi:hypothetical protein
MSNNILDIIQEKNIVVNSRKESDSINYFFDKVFVWTKAEVITLIHNPYINMTSNEKSDVLFSLQRSLKSVYISVDYYKHHLRMLWIEFQDAAEAEKLWYNKDISA